MVLSAESSSILQGIVNTLIASAALYLAYLLLYFFTIKKISNLRNRRKYRLRVIYSLNFIFLICVVRIWINGLSHFFTMLGLVAAGLVLVNKESLMNLTGWFIILWRDLFSEGDHIKIQDHYGFVTTLGIFYFTLSEFDHSQRKALRGRIIKIPNGLVINCPLINYSQISAFLRYNLVVVITTNTSVDEAKKTVQQTIAQVLKKYYPNDILPLVPKQAVWEIEMVHAKPKIEAPAGIAITAHYYCKAADHEAVEEDMWDELLKQFHQSNHLELAYEQPTAQQPVA